MNQYVQGILDQILNDVKQRSPEMSNDQKMFIVMQIVSGFLIMRFHAEGKDERINEMMSLVQENPENSVSMMLDYLTPEVDEEFQAYYKEILENYEEFVRMGQESLAQMQKEQGSQGPIPPQTNNAN